jgi:hypothetical protein
VSQTGKVAWYVTEMYEWSGQSELWMSKIDGTIGIKSAHNSRTKELIGINISHLTPEEGCGKTSSMFQDSMDYY